MVGPPKAGRQEGREAAWAKGRQEGMQGRREVPCPMGRQEGTSAGRVAAFNNRQRG